MMKKSNWMVLVLLITGCRAARYTHVDITGVAGNARGGAEVMTTDETFYFIGNKETWEDGILDKRIRIQGDMEVIHYKTKPIKNGQWVDQISGKKVIHHPVITILGDSIMQ